MLITSESNSQKVWLQRSKLRIPSLKICFTQWTEPKVRADFKQEKSDKSQPSVQHEHKCNSTHSSPAGTFCYVLLPSELPSSFITKTQLFSGNPPQRFWSMLTSHSCWRFVRSVMWICRSTTSHSCFIGCRFIAVNLQPFPRSQALFLTSCIFKDWP